MKPFDTFQVDPLLTLLDFLAKTSTPIRSVYKFSLLVPDLVLYQNGAPDAWFFSNKKQVVESRPHACLSNQAIFRYFKKHSAFPSLAGIVRIKVEDEKYYSLVDIGTLEKVLSGPSDGPPLQSWDSLSFFMPFLKGGIFTANWKNGEITLYKHEVFGYNDPVFQQAILGAFPSRKAQPMQYNLKLLGAFNASLKTYTKSFVSLIERLVGGCLSEVQIDVLKDDNDSLWLLDIREVILSEAPEQPKKSKICFKCPGRYCGVNERSELIKRSEDDQTFQFFNRFGDYMLGWIHLAHQTPGGRVERMPEMYGELRLVCDIGELLKRNAFISGLYDKTRVCCNCYQVYSKLDIQRQKQQEKKLRKIKSEGKLKKTNKKVSLRESGKVTKIKDLLSSLEQTSAKLAYIRNMDQDQCDAALNFLTPVQYDKKQYQRSARLSKEKKSVTKSTSTDTTEPTKPIFDEYVASVREQGSRYEEREGDALPDYPLFGREH